MTDIDSYCSSKYLRACDLDGKDATLTIGEVSQTEYEDGTKRPLIHWQEKGVKPFGCNQTNKNTIIAMYGRDTEAMKGKPITLYPTTTEYKGMTTPCIRFRQSVSQVDAPPSTPVQHEPSETPQANEVAKVDLLAEYRDRIDLVKSAGMPDLFDDILRDIFRNKALGGAAMKALASDIEVARSHCTPTEKATEEAVDDQQQCMDEYAKAINGALMITQVNDLADQVLNNDNLSSLNKLRVSKWRDDRCADIRASRGSKKSQSEPEGT